ncbi:MAG: ABC transporter substrate-binding protein [Rhodospirillales bacterium]|nr:ABC transporter substrate-binding protein [Rhodospirillales bacterium]
MRALTALFAGLLLVVPATAQDEQIYDEQIRDEQIRGGHGISIYGDLKYPADFPHFDYVNPDAPKGGDVRMWSFGGFDTLNGFTLKGQAAPGLGQVYDTLLKSASDETFSEYGLLAGEILMPEDRSWVAFKLRPEARWHDGMPVTVEDVIWTFETLTTEGHPYYAAYYANVVGATDGGGGWVRFDFDAPGNRELPLIMGQMQVLPKHWWADRVFNETTLEPPLGSGPYRVIDVDPGRSVTYERVEDYWGADIPVNVGFNNFDTVRYDEYLDFDIALEAFKANQYDFRIENNSKRWATAYNGPDFDNGLIVREELHHQRPTGMQAFVFNTRRAIFADPRVRRALGHAFDFEWSNRNLFYGQYARTTSYFSNSDLAAVGMPSEAELALLEPFRDRLPAEVFGEPAMPSVTDGSGNIRSQLREAKALLEDAGWTVQDGVLVGPEGDAMAFEILLVQPAFERIVQPFARNLERLGVRVDIRIVDAAQYERRLETFDFDMAVASFGQSRSPGNEQREYWTSEAAGIEGSRNLIGIRDPAVDALVETLIFSDTRDALVTAARALDRVLRAGHYVVPNWHSRHDRVAYWDKFAHPETIPDDGIVFFTWWIDAEEQAELDALLEEEDG